MLTAALTLSTTVLLVATLATLPQAALFSSGGEGDEPPAASAGRTHEHGVAQPKPAKTGSAGDTVERHAKMVAVYL
jgi:hypothetical protein